MANYYLFETVDKSIESVRVRRGVDPPKIMNQGGGWQVVSRARRRSATLWSGDDPARVAVPILFDDWKGRIAQDRSIDLLRLMSMSPAPGKEPPKLKVSGGIPIIAKVWVIEGIDWGDNQIWDSKTLGRFRQDAVVRLLEWVEPSVVISAPGAPNAPGQTQGNTRNNYTVKAGDSLATIAVSIYGDRSMWADIADKNGIRDPLAIIPGASLVLP